MFFNILKDFELHGKQKNKGAQEWVDYCTSTVCITALTEINCTSGYSVMI